jgi:fimbrial isopeptide formation D2 family protein/LPXTG-motif cell wall-anchored protein
VTLPLTDPDDRDEWLYDVHVYPKNAVTTATKTVEDSEDIKLGDAIEWTITADVPDVEEIDAYKIVDDLDAKLDYVSSSVSLSDGTALVEGTHYTVVPASATTGGPAVTIELTQAGRDLLEARNELDSQVQVIAVITTTVNAIGEIVNTAAVYPNAASYNYAPGTPGGPVVTPPVITKWGNITVEKINEAGAALAGAVFSVYATEADAINGTNPIVLGGATEFTVAADGTVTISGLRYSDWADGVAVAPGAPNYQTYWLAEVVAPTGYELLADPIEFTVTAATTAVGVDLEVINVPSNGGFELPLTGGTGTTMFWAGGTMLLAGAVFLAVHSRRKTNAAA